MRKLNETETIHILILTLGVLMFLALWAWDSCGATKIKTKKHEQTLQSR